MYEWDYTRVKSLFDKTRASFNPELPHGISVIPGRERGQFQEVNSLKNRKFPFSNFFFLSSFYHFPFTFHHFLSFPLRNFPLGRDIEENHVTAMEEKHAAANESAHAESNGVSHGADHGWQKVTYAKKQKKKTVNAANSADSRANSNKLVPNGTLSGNDGVFRSLELQSEDRRRKIVEAKKLADAAYDDEDAPLRSKQRHHDDDEYDYDDENVDRSAENGKAEEAKKVKQKKPKKPKVTVAEAAAKIDAADLGAFLVEISVGHCELNRACLGFVFFGLIYLDQEDDVMRFV